MRQRRSTPSLLESVIALLLASALPACRTAARYQHADPAYYRGNPERILEAYAEAEADRGKDALLGKMKLLSAALLLREWDDAEAFALEVSTDVNVYLAGQAGERDALSAFGREADKPFKGEPHEQAMADFYLGLLRFRRGDYEGALSCFRSALQKDRGSYLLPVKAEEARRGHPNTERYLYEADWTSLELFAAICWSELGEEEAAARSLGRARELRPELAPLLDAAMDPRSVIVLIEAGRAPRKIRSGPRGAVLDYVPGSRVEVERVSLAGRELSFGLTDDLYHQATTLGRRQVDELNLVKARRQEALHDIGLAATVAGTWVALTSRNKDVRHAGLIGAAVGLLTMAFSEAAFEPGADTRAWTLLPGTLYIAVGKRGRDEGRLEIAATNSIDSIDPGVRIEGIAPGEESRLLWVRLLPRVRSTFGVARHPYVLRPGAYRQRSISQETATDEETKRPFPSPRRS